MKVLETINIDTWTHVLTCSFCSSKLEINKGDIFFTSKIYKWDTFIITCPVCNNHSCLDQSIIPRMIRSKIKEEQNGI